MKCSRCGVVKPLTEFPIARVRRNGSPRYAYCKLCHCAYQQVNRWRNLFNLTPADVQTLTTYQLNICAICKRSPKLGKQLSIDHRHSDGLIRGKLCWICNRLLGMANDDAARLTAAAAYLNNPPATLAFKEERFGAPGRIGTKAQRRKIKKLQKERAHYLKETQTK